MAVKTLLGDSFYIWHPGSGIQRGATLYILAHAERSLVPTAVMLPPGTSMEFLAADGQNLMAEPIQNAFARGGALRYGMASTMHVDNYNLFKSTSDVPRPSGNVENYDSISAIPDSRMTNIRSDILTVRKRATSWSFNSAVPYVHRGSDLKDIFSALAQAGIHYSRLVAYFCRGNPFSKASTMSAFYVNNHL